MERNMAGRNQDSDERSDRSEEGDAEHSEFKSSEENEDDNSQNIYHSLASEEKNDNSQNISDSLASDVKNDEHMHDVDDFKSETSLDKLEELCDEGMECNEIRPTQTLQNSNSQGLIGSKECVAIYSVSYNKDLSASTEIVSNKLNRPELPVNTYSEQLPKRDLEEDTTVNLPLSAEEMDDFICAESLDKITICEPAAIRESNDSLPNLKILFVCETKSEFARHPDSTSKQQLSHGVDDQEAELDFEEEVNIDRGDEREEVAEQEDNGDKVFGENMDDLDDDGEVEDDDDLEEGEVKEPASSARKPHQRPICRFFNRGQCTWGTACRFIHPGINNKGNYNMFAPIKPLVPYNGPVAGGLTGMPLGPLRGHPGYRGRAIAEVVVQPPQLQAVPAVESAWERGLRQAKENLRKANKRKETEPDFEEKRFNLSLTAVEPEIEKENDYFSRSPFNKTSEACQTFGYEDNPDPNDRHAQEFWRGGNYENFEVRYLRPDYSYRQKDKENKAKPRREKFGRFEHVQSKDRVGRGRGGGSRNNRYVQIKETNRNLPADEWKDPWRRSTSPKRRDRGKSHSSAASGTSYSSKSSHSRSSSFSSRSCSGSSRSSRNSRSYSRSRSRKHQSPRHRHTVASPPSNAARRKPPPAKPSITKSKAPPFKTSRPAPEKRVAIPRSIPIVPPPLRAELKKKRQPLALLEKPPPTEKRLPSSTRPKQLQTRGISRSNSDSSLSQSSPSRSSSRSSISSRSRSRSSSVNSNSDSGLRSNARERERDPEHEQQRKIKVCLDSQIKVGCVTSGSKDPLKQSGQKPQIKLTLLNKAKTQLENAGICIASQTETGIAAKVKPLQTKECKVIPRLPPPAVILGLQSPPKKPIPSPTPKPEPKPVQFPVIPPATLRTSDNAKPLKLPLSLSGINRKRAASASSPTINPLSQVVSRTVSSLPPQQLSQSPPPPQLLPLSVPKKSTLSRREELLKQLKAVEDAIARKRAKLT